MVTKEVFKTEPYKNMPYPGTKPHLDWLRALNYSHDLAPVDFLYDTAAHTTIARQIRRHRIEENFAHLQYSNTISLDSRFMKGFKGVWEPERFFSGCLNIYGAFGQGLSSKQEVPMPDTELRDFSDPIPRSHNLLFLSGRPHPNSNVHSDFIYSLKIPLTHGLLLDPTRSLQATIEDSGPKKMTSQIFSGPQQRPKVSRYNQPIYQDGFDKLDVHAANTDNDPAVFFSAFRSAIADFHFLVDYQFGGRNSLVFFPRESKRRAISLGRLANSVTGSVVIPK